MSYEHARYGETQMTSRANLRIGPSAFLALRVPAPA